MPRSGFMQCLDKWQLGDDEDTQCPDANKEHGYRHKFVLYEDTDSTVGCAPCTCGPPIGSQCIASVSTYQDASCVTPIFENHFISTSTPQCVQVDPNVPLQGASSKWIVNQSGKCVPSGGNPTGKVTPDSATAHAFCCWE